MLLKSRATHSIKFKSKILFSTILGVLLLILCAINYFSLKHILIRNLDTTLTDEVIDVRSTLELFEHIDDPFSMNFNQPEIERMMHRYFPSKNKKIQLLRRWWEQESTKLGLNKRFVAVYDKNKSLLVDLRDKKQKLNAKDIENISFSSRQKITTSIRFNNEKYRIINYPFTNGNYVYVIRIGTSLKPVYKVLNRFTVYMLVSVLLIVIITSFLGRILADNVLNPISKIIKIANDISHKDLTKRISEINADVELQELIDAFNGMLERLNKSFSQINEFSSHVAHELKTPLAVIKGEMEVALMSDRSTIEYKEVLEVCLEEVDRQKKIVDDLLFIARVDFKKEILNIEKIEMYKFINDVYEQYSIVAQDQSFLLELNKDDKSEAYINGDKSQLRRMFFNLLNNALKYGYKGSQIDFSIKKIDEQIEIKITDRGKGIKQKDLPRIFEKFYRSTEMDENKAFSCGLGLSMVDSIVKAHNGNVFVESQEGIGTTFRIYLPLFKD